MNLFLQTAVISLQIFTLGSAAADTTHITVDNDLWKYQTKTLLFTLDTTASFSDQAATVIEFQQELNREMEMCYTRAGDSGISEIEVDSLRDRVFSLSMMEQFLKFIAFEEMAPKFCEDAGKAMTQRYTSSPETEFHKLPRECQDVYTILNKMCNSAD